MKARKICISLMLLSGIALAAAPNAAALAPTAPAALALAWLEQDVPKSVDINITTSDGGANWYKNPIVIGAGALLLVLIVVLASRGGSGTTIVKT